MAQFRVKTVDSAYTYERDIPATIVQSPEDNSRKSNTQGFLFKKQVGQKRVRITATIEDTKTNIEANLIPQLTHPTSVELTIDRNILFTTATTGEFVIDDYDMPEEFDDGETQLMRIKFVQVITQ